MTMVRCAAWLSFLLILGGCEDGPSDESISAEKSSQPGDPDGSFEPRKIASFGVNELKQIREIFEALKSGRQEISRSKSRGDIRNSLFYEYLVAAVNEFRESNRGKLPQAAGRPDFDLNGVVFIARNA